MGWKLLLLASFAAFQHNTFVFIQQFLRRDKCNVLVGWNKGWAAGGQAQILPEARDTEKQSHPQRFELWQGPENLSSKMCSQNPAADKHYSAANHCFVQTFRLTKCLMMEKPMEGAEWIGEMLPYVFMNTRCDHVVILLGRICVVFDGMFCSCIQNVLPHSWCVGVTWKSENCSSCFLLSFWTLLWASFQSGSA